MLRSMKTLCAFLLLASVLTLSAQTNAVQVDDLARWAQENLDDNVLNALQGTNQDQAKKFFEQVQKEFHGEYVVDLAQLRDAAQIILPILEANDDTAPYAAWLKARLDYLDAAEDLRLSIAPPKTGTNQPPRLANPQPEIVREIWIKKISTRPPPDDAAPYIKQLKPIFAQEKVPTELVWLAEVESSFDPEARSPAGAAGLFQLMPQTAKQYGLRTWIFDERENPEQSAHAAAKHLNHLYARFKDWRLALAAYNSGEGTVQNLLKRYNARTFDAIAPHLPAETQMYVPKVEATVLRREGVRLSQLSRPAT